MRKLTALLCSAYALALTAAPLPAAVLNIALPLETAAFKPGPGPGSDIANAQCLICHSVEYVSTQPPFPRAFWAATVKKMRDKFGAPIPEAQVAPLVDYLANTYGTGTNAAPAPTPAIAAKAGLPIAPAQAGTAKALATKYGCLECHHVDAKVVGPAYKDIAAKYRGHPDALARISDQIHKGGSGKWGSVIMPPFPMVNDQETKILAEWVLSRK